VRPRRDPPRRALADAFLFFLLALSLFACPQLAAVHEEAAEQRLETLFALPVGRRRWLAVRLAIAAGVAVVPRAGVAVAYGLVGVAFLWDAVGALAGAPGWLLALSPFHDVGLVPAEPFEPAGAPVMLALAALAAALATREFARRDLAEQTVPVDVHVVGIGQRGRPVDDHLEPDAVAGLDAGDLRVHEPQLTVAGEAALRVDDADLAAFVEACDAHGCRGDRPLPANP
jgi:hypothetical protein